jgi:hypothetical protein
VVSDGEAPTGRDRFTAVDGVDCRPLGAAIGPGSNGPAVADGESAGLDAAAVDNADAVSAAVVEVADGMAEVVDGTEVVGWLEELVGGPEVAVGGLADVVAAAVVGSSLVVDPWAAT